MEFISSENIYKIFYVIAFICFIIGLFKRNQGRPVINNNQEINQCIIYLTKQIRRQAPEYKPNKDIYRRFQKNNTDEMVLTALARDILKHCHFTPAALFVRVNKNNRPQDIAGMYKIQGHDSTIEINYHADMREEEILAILIHECMHFYLRCRNLGYSNKDKNELLTDTTTIYMGFYKYMKAGYGRVGYISPSTIDYIHNTLQQITANK